MSERAQARPPPSPLRRPERDSPLIMGTESLSAIAMSTKAMSERYVALRRLPSSVPSPTPNHRRVSAIVTGGALDRGAHSGTVEHRN